MKEATSKIEIDQLDRYFRRLRESKYFHKTIFGIGVESNLCHVRAKDICVYLEAHHRPNRIMQEDPESLNRPGVWIGPKDKDRWVLFFNKFLQRDNITFHQPFFCADPSRTQMVQQQILQQMSVFRSAPKKPADPTVADTKRFWTGKDKASGQKDDLAIALIGAAYWFAVMYGTERYMYPWPTKLINGSEDFRHLNPSSRKRPHSAV
jgi:hypothetical protein